MFRFSLRQLQYFIKVAEMGSLADAARELHVSQPSISSAIVKLELALDVQLFVRHHAQGVSLTSAGGRMLDESRALLAHAEDFRQSAQGFGGQVQGRLHVGCFGPIASLYLPSLISSFQSLYPNVELRIYEDNSENLIRGLESNRYDIAMMYDLGVPETMLSARLIELKPYAIVSEDHPLVVQEKVSLKQLAKHPMVLLDMPRSREYFSMLFGQRDLMPMISIRSPSFELVRGLVANGLGFSILVTKPEHSLAYDGKRVVEREIIDEMPSTNVVLVHTIKNRPTRLLEVFIAHCQEYISIA